MSLSRFTAVVLTTLASAELARAHNIEVSCKVDPPDRVVVSVYVGTVPAAGATVRATDPQGHEIATGAADTGGQCVFTVPDAAAYTFEATIAGHRARCQLDPEQVGILAQARNSSPTAVAPRSESGARTVAESEHGAADDHEHPSNVAHTHDLADRREHTAGFPTVELVAGLALILAVAALSMSWSLRRDFRAYLDRQGRSGG